MVTNRNHRSKRHRLEHPAMIGQGVVIGYQYSLGIGKPLMGRNTGLKEPTSFPDNEPGREPGIGVQVEPTAS